MRVTIKSNKYGIMRVRPTFSCGDMLMGLETIGNKSYEVYLGFCGYASYYAVEV